VIPDRILGIDVGVRCGFAVLAGERIVESGVAHLQEPETRYGLRFQVARELFSRLVIQHRPRVIVYERMGFFRSFDAARSMFGVVAMIDEVAARNLVDLAIVPIMTVKKIATGSGKATKANMREAAKKRWRLAKVRNDEADALWIAETYRLKELAT
jgi:Holliday junction resolvasome RuvABC endonuclease subunit